MGAMFDEPDEHCYDMSNGCTLYLYSKEFNQILKRLVVEDTETKEVLIDWNFEEIS